MVEKLELALLGSPEIHLAGQPLARLRSAKAYALLYYLAVTRQAQPRTVLAGLFWGDVAEYYARRNLNRTLSDLTKFVGDHLVVERQSLAFARGQPYWLDVEVLEETAAVLPTAQNVTMLASAVDLYRGDFLAGFYVQDAPEFEQWVLNERTRLRASVLQLHHALSQLHAEVGDLGQGIEHVRRILQLEPWNEEAHRQLILLLAQSGQRSAALAQFELCRQALCSELNVEPDAATLELVERIRAGNLEKVTVGKMAAESPITTSPLHPFTLSPPHNLPTQRTPFVGREIELADIMRLLVEDDDCRLLTLIGLGGIGKTRLALKAAEQIASSPAMQECFGDGVFFVPIENVYDADGLVAAVFAAVTGESGRARHMETQLEKQLANHLRPKAMLLVLDNFEHLISHAQLCSTILTAAPRVKLLVTSRKALNLQEAWRYPLLGLSIPDGSLEQATEQREYDAVRLFVQCARRARPNFTPEAERAAVLRICSLLDGMPLAIELAAAWLSVMSCEQIAQEVTRELDFLTAHYQNIPVRHHSMRMVMEQTWSLLSADEEAAIARLSIFRGRFRQESARTITGISLYTLATLAEKALVRVTSDGLYQLHELIRQYAEEKLENAVKSDLRDAHAVYYAGLLDRQRPLLFTVAYRQVWATVGGELDNIRHAWQWIIDAASEARNDLPLTHLLRQMAEVLNCYHLFHSLWLPGQLLFDQACQVLEAAGWASSNDSPDEQPSQRAALLQLQICSGQFQLEMGHHRASLALAEQTLAASREYGLEEDLFRALMIYGYTQVRRGARPEAAPAFQEALGLGERLRSLRYRAEALIGMGMTASNEGRYTDAQSHYRQALALCQQMGYRPWVARALTNLGTTYSRQYDYHQARPYYEQALAIAQEEGDQSFVMICTSNLGNVQRGFGRHQLSIDYYQRSLSMARTLGEERWIAANLNGLSTTYLETGDLTGAEHALHEALIMGQQSDSLSDTLGSISLLGHLFARRNQVDIALKMLTFVERHPATMARDRLYNQPLFAELRSELAPEQFEQAEVWATGQALDDVVQWLLHRESAITVPQP